MYAGVVFILLGLFLNFIGGLSPQKLGAVSDIAKEMDSFAELVTFCIAPSILAYIVSLNTLPYIGVLCSLAFSICGVLRLSRINVEQNKLTLFTGMADSFRSNVPYHIKLYEPYGIIGDWNMWTFLFNGQ